MAGVNQVFSLADDVARYVKACGKKSILQTKPFRKNTNPKELGYIHPDGMIIFQTNDVAQKYAKNRVMQALHLEEPFERGVFINKNIILEEINGNNNSIDLISTKIFKQRNCGLDKEIDVNETIEFVHGHPDYFGKGYTMPLTGGDGFTFPSDYAVMIGHNLKKVTAYNSLGEFNTITWLGNKTKLEAIQKHSSDYWNYLAKLLDKKDYEHYKDFMQKCIKYVQENNGQLSLELIEENQVITSKIIEKAEKLLNTRRGAKICHGLWRRNASEYGVSYSTNFSNLV